MILTPYQEDVMCGKICPYCKSETRITSETEIYGREYKNRKVICCINFPNCDSYVGTHDDGESLGRLANKELRHWKKKAHDKFDLLWKEKLIDRDSAYEKLADFLMIPDKYTHIGMFSEQTCKKVYAWSILTYNELK